MPHPTVKAILKEKPGHKLTIQDLQGKWLYYQGLELPPQSLMHSAEISDECVSEDFLSLVHLSLLLL